MPADALLGDVDRGFKLGMMTLDRLRPTVGAAACGMAARALDEALDHAATRRQFGQPIGDFQLVREKLGRMATELARCPAARLSRGVDRRTAAPSGSRSKPRWPRATPPRRRSASSTTPCRSSAAPACCVGNPVERLYRSVRALRIYEGATEVQRLIIGGRAAAGRGAQRDPAAGHRLHRRRSRRPVLRAPDEEGRPAPPRPRHRAQPRRTTRSDSASCSPTRRWSASREADADAYDEIARHLVHWDDIDVHYRGEVHPLDRPRLQRHQPPHAAARAPGAGRRRRRRAAVRVARSPVARRRFADADLVVGADGANSSVRRLLRRRASQTAIDVRPNRFVWLGTTKPFPAFTFYFKQNEHGLWRVHAYEYEPGRSTFIVECRDETWRAAGLDRATEDESAAFLERAVRRGARRPSR